MVADGWTVIGTTRSEAKAPLLRDLGVEPAIVDVYDAARLRELVCEAKPGVVIHQLTDLPPGLDPEKMADALIRNARIREVGTCNLVGAALAAGARRMVAQSLAFVYAAGPLPHREDDPLMLDDPNYGRTSRAVASLEEQIVSAPLTGIVLRYGKLYGPGTGFDDAPEGGPIHVDDAADAARLAATRGDTGIYNIAEDDGTVSIQKARDILGWKPGFRIG